MAKKSMGTKFGYAERNSTTFVNFATVTEIKPPKITVDSIDTTHLESVDSYKEKIAGWLESGDAEITVQYDKTQTATIFGLVAEDKSFQILLPDGSKLLFDGFVNGVEPILDKDGLITSTVTFAVSGAVEFTAAA